MTLHGPALTRSPAGSTQLSHLEARIKAAVRQFPDWPLKGILFEDILPIFADPKLFADLIDALELLIKEKLDSKPDVIVGLEARGFLFGPTLALRLGAAFVPIRKKGKLPGPVETDVYQKEYGEDHFQIQSDAFKKGSKVLVVDDLIATGGSALCAGNLVKKIGGELLGYLFLIELGFLNGREKLGGAPVHTLLSGQDTEEERGL